MKKLLKLFLFIILSISILFIITGCLGSSHKHTYSKKWSYDDEYHWHSATCEHTDLISDKAKHSLDNGVITKKATETEDGEIVYTCTVCHATIKVIIPKGTNYNNEGEWDFIK